MNHQNVCQHQFIDIFVKVLNFYRYHTNPKIKLNIKKEY